MTQNSRKEYFYNDAVSNYLIIRCPQKALEGYQYRMLAANRIDGILSGSLRTIDGETCLYYDVTGCESLSMQMGNSVLSGEEMKRFLYSMAAMLESLSDFLLDASHLLLDPNYIFHDFEKEGWRFTYYPEMQMEDGMQRLFEYLAERVDSSDPEGTAVIYHLCDMAGKPGFILRRDLLDHEYEAVRPEERKTGYGEKSGCVLPYEGEETVFQCEGRREVVSGKEENPSAEENMGLKSKAEKRSPGGILALAVFFLIGAAAMEAGRFLVDMTEEQRTAVHAGMIALLTMALVTSLYGALFTYRSNRKEVCIEQNEEKERKRNAMTPSAEFECGMMNGTNLSQQTERGYKR